MSEMNKWRSRTPLAVAVATALLMAGCGGSDNNGSGNGSTGGSTGNPGTGNTGGNNGGGNTPAPITVAGKAADGYLNGAKVCLDIDRDMKCDDGEPFATTGAGGAFTLTIPDGVNAADHPIVVEVSDSTIDEDTNTAVGKPYVLSAPAGQSGFISPLTTAVHGVLARNPALTLDEAAAQVKLSIGASSDVSLFEDYVAAKDDADSETADGYQRLHRIAQVSAKALAENHEAIMAAATEQGIDPSQSNAALLTLIVEQALNQLEDAAQAVDEAGEEFDVNAVEVSTAEPTDLAQQIEAIETFATATKVSIQSLLEQGVYWMWSEGEEFEYGQTKAGSEAGRLQETWFIYDQGVWEQADDESADTPSFLGPDGWTPKADTAHNFAVTYGTDGTATLDLDDVDFTLKYSAAEVDVSGKPIKDYLTFSAHEPVAETIAGNPLFSSGAKIYQVNFISQTDAYMIDNLYGCDPQHADASGNCNVIFGFASNQAFAPAKSFAELIYPTEPQGGNWFGVGDGLDIRIVADGRVQITDNQAPEGSQVSYGSWEFRTVHGQQIMMLTLPEKFTSRFWDGGQQILAVMDGYVRRGTFLPAGTPEEIGEIQFNEIAFQDIQDNSSIY